MSNAILDYMNNAEKSKAIINDWVLSYTDGKVKDLFTKLHPNTTCVVVSCTYFKTDWYNKFYPGNTYNAKFYCAQKKASIAKMMLQESCFSYISVYEKGYK